jgi:hypothetical protein
MLSSAQLVHIASGSAFRPKDTHALWISAECLDDS